jgi:hypothetical protein
MSQSNEDQQRDSTPKRSRRWLQFSLGSLLTVLTLVAVVFGIWSWNRPNAPVEVHIILEQGPRKTKQYVIQDKALIRKLVFEPLRNAKKDPDPAKYIIVGSLGLVYEDGTTEWSTLFLSFGHLKRGGEYFVADFDQLREYLITQGAERI